MFRSQTRSNGRSHLVFSPTTLKSDTLAIPALLSASSALLLVVHFSTRKIVKRVFGVEDEAEQGPAVEENPLRGYVAKLRHHAKHYGGVTIFTYRVLRLLAVLNLVGLTVTALVLSSKDAEHTIHHHTRFLNWSLLGAYVRIPLLADCRKFSPSFSSMHPSWLWLPYQHPQKSQMLQTPTSSGSCLALGLFTVIGTSILLEPLPFNLSTSRRVGSCGRSSEFLPLLLPLSRHSFQPNTFHSIPRFVPTCCLTSSTELTPTYTEPSYGY